MTIAIGLHPVAVRQHLFTMISASHRPLIDSAVASDLLYANRHTLAHTALLHCHAIELVARLHGSLVMRDDDEVAVVQEWHQNLTEAIDVRVIQRGVNLIENAEWRWLAL